MRDPSVSLAAEVLTHATSGLKQPGRVALAAALGGGLLLGGFLVALATLFEQRVVTGASEVAPIAFTIGTLLGLVHGSVLGYLGRP